VNLVSTCFATAYVLVCAGSVLLRVTRPHQKRLYKAPGGVAPGVIAAGFAVLILVESLYQPYVTAKGAFPLEWIALLIWVTLGMLFWVIARKWRETVTEPERRELLFGSRTISN